MSEARPAYTGVGSRETPAEVLELIGKVARALALRGYELRTGGAVGADTAFLRGANIRGGKVAVFLPWPGFAQIPMGPAEFRIHEAPSREAYELSSHFHPAWDRLSSGARALHARNAHEVLGPLLVTPSRFVVCWTLNGSGAGGTGQALRIAEHYHVPCFDLALPGVRERLERMCESL